MSVDFDYDENQGNPAHTDCLLSMETDNNFYVATSGALPWREPEDTPGDRMRGWCLEYINRWPSVFVDELQLIAAEDGDPDSVRDFKDFDELQLAADQCMDRLLTRSNEFPGLVAVEAEVDGSTWDDLEPITGRSSLAWLEGVTLEMLCAGTGTLVESYVALIVGRLKTAVEHIVPEWVLEGEHG
ncbi:hypothetical protein AB1Y20_007513 [Prymnesium parvum]|uniref:Uncharacterized protein n=1 Tax=Prymnesium parvum TaxID=97485 RepID=A0AB34IXM9_PRYPA